MTIELVPEDLVNKGYPRIQIDKNEKNYIYKLFIDGVEIHTINLAYSLIGRFTAEDHRKTDCLMTIGFDENDKILSQNRYIVGDYKIETPKYKLMNIYGIVSHLEEQKRIKSEEKLENDVGAFNFLEI